VPYDISWHRPSNNAFLDDSIPKIQIIVLLIQLVVSNQGQMLVYLPPQVLPVSLDLLPDGMRPESLLQCQHVLIVANWLL
jgi:hypothetical protein